MSCHKSRVLVAAPTMSLAWVARVTGSPGLPSQCQPGRLSEPWLFQVERMIADGREESQVEGSNRRWTGVIAGGGEQSEVVGSYRRWRGGIAGGGERSEVEGSYQWRGAITGGRKQSEVEESNCRWRRGIAGGGEQSQEEGSDSRWRELSQVWAISVLVPGL